MKQLNPLFDIEGIAPDFEFEARVLEKNNREVNLFIKKGYKIIYLSVKFGGEELSDSAA